MTKNLISCTHKLCNMIQIGYISKKDIRCLINNSLLPTANHLKQSLAAY